MRKQWMVAAATVMTLVGAAHAEIQTTQLVDAATRQRAEVRADLELWHQAGMSFLPSPAAYPQVRETAQYRKYEQLRNGPAFQEAVAKYLPASHTLAQQGEIAKQP
ncbi:hypothetical protein [Comamonas sp. GB3 AK4-5]|uniref:hypothetical protein n=1 Tax=Comamonas sp. GB3 AK4-5 TaxID=3231487 RepID=UPI00351EECC8